jgi:SAM-dependent methyltransferase
MQSSIYGDDLAMVQASGFGEFAAAAIQEVIPKLRSFGVKRVIDVGCGAGVSTRALADAGFEVLGIEQSEALLPYARSAAPGAAFRLASAYETDFPPCDAVLALGETLSYHRPDVDAHARVRGFFRSVSQALRYGGLLVFDVIDDDGEPLNARGWSRGADWVVLHESLEDRATRRLVRNIETFRLTATGTYRRTSETHDVCLFDGHAVKAWLEQEGFDAEVETAYGSFALSRRRLAFTAVRRH